LKVEKRSGDLVFLFFLGRVVLQVASLTVRTPRVFLIEIDRGELWLFIFRQRNFLNPPEWEKWRDYEAEQKSLPENAGGNGDSNVQR
jgi:hypothetical protein